MRLTVSRAVLRLESSWVPFKAVDNPEAPEARV
jgi:hypothetical protein